MLIYKFSCCFFLQPYSSNRPMMKKNQSTDSITKPNDANGSDEITNLQDERLAPAGEWATSSLIVQRTIMMQNPSLMGWGGNMLSLCLQCSLQSE